MIALALIAAVMLVYLLLVLSWCRASARADAAMDTYHDPVVCPTDRGDKT
jgi:hypothetical protein